MNSHPKHPDKQNQDMGHGSLRTYTIGFILSLILTLAAYFATTNHVFSGSMLVTLLMVLAVVQLLVQLLFFLHLGSESKPRWNQLIFSFMFLVLLIIVIGSLWIMNNLDYHNMSPKETDTYIREKERIN